MQMLSLNVMYSSCYIATVCMEYRAQLPLALMLGALYQYPRVHCYMCTMK